MAVGSNGASGSGDSEGWPSQGARRFIAEKAKWVGLGAGESQAGQGTQGTERSALRAPSVS